MTIQKRTGLDINEISVGHGPEHGFLLHCTLGNAGSLTRFGNGFSDKMIMTGFDLPGHGKSQDWTFEEDYQNRILAITESFITVPTHLIGHSFGATVALRFAHKHPHLVKSMVLFEPVFFQAALNAQPDLGDRYFPLHTPFVDALAAKDHITSARLFLSDWGDGTPWEDLPEAFRAAAIERMPLVGAGATSVHQDLGGLLEPNGLSRVNAPTLFMRGQKTHFMIPHIHKALCDMMPNALDIEIPGAGHMVPITHAKHCIEVAARFYENIS
jgi:lipase